MKKMILMYLFLISALFIFLVSCGIPQMLVPLEGAVTFSSTSDGDTTITRISVNEEYLKSDACVSSSSPEVNFFYIIRGSSNSSQYRTAIDKFNTEFSNSYDSVILTGRGENGSPFYTYKSGSNEYNVWQFRDNRPLTGPEFINNSSSFDFSFSRDSDSGDLLYTVLDSNGNPVRSGIVLKSSNNYSFSDLSSLSAETADSTSSRLELVVYAAVTYTFRDYSNDWNTKLNQVFECIL